jgi:hypothetical protein
MIAQAGGRSQYGESSGRKPKPLESAGHWWLNCQRELKNTDQKTHNIQFA